MNIVYAGNQNVFKGMLLGTLSLLKHYDDVLNVYLLTMDLRESDASYLAVEDDSVALLTKVVQEVNPQSEVIKVDVKDLYLKHLADGPNTKTRYTAYTLLRLLLDEISDMPAKVLYLDTDTMFNADPRAFYDHDLKDYELAGVKDRYGRFFMAPRYFNAGVLLFNLEKIKETGLFKKARTYLNSKEVFLSDQTAINKFVKRKLIVPRRYNEQKEVKKDTVIRHFSMQFRLFPKFHFINIKQWDKAKVHAIYKCHDFDDILAQYEQITKESL